MTTPEVTVHRVASWSVAVSLLAVAAMAQDPADQKAWQEHRKIRVLYAGGEGGSREQAFAPFLKQWFDTVGVIPIGKLSAATAQDYDLVIADWGSQYGNDGYPKRENSLTSAPATLPESFTKPVFAMDYVSSNLRPQGKLDWL
jgi:hypothetical protein